MVQMLINVVGELFRYLACRRSLLLDWPGLSAVSHHYYKNFAHEFLGQTKAVAAFLRYLGFPLELSLN